VLGIIYRRTPRKKIALDLLFINRKMMVSLNFQIATVILVSDQSPWRSLELSNNLAENAIRPLALGRRNGIHIGSEQAGPRVAAIISVVNLPAIENPDSRLSWLDLARLGQLPDQSDRRAHACSLAGSKLTTQIPSSSWAPLTVC
jgi:hypothetical protein